MDSVADVVVAVVIGLVAGAYSGLLGVGGGIVMVPGMVLLLGQSQHVAEGTSLLVIIPAAIAGTRAYARRGLAHRPLAGWLASGGMVGAAVGSLLAVRVIGGEAILRRLFAVFLLVVAARLAVRRPAPGSDSGYPPAG